MFNTGTALRFTADQFATSAAIRNSANVIALNQWQHVAVTWDGSADASNIVFYINGVNANVAGDNGTDGVGPVGRLLAGPP